MRPGPRIARAVAALGGAAALLAYAFTGGPATAADVTVTATGSNTFSPQSVTIDPGDTVTWQYGGSFSHTVTSTSANWSKDDPLGPPTTTFSTSYLFDRPGTYTYVCKTHESTGMTGTVVVRGTTPKPTTTRPTTKPSPTRTTTSPAVRPTSAAPSASTSTAVPPILISGSPSPGAPTPTATVPPPSLAPQPTGTPYLGTGGLGTPPATGRAKGLPVMLALLLVMGVGSAEVRAVRLTDPA
jgi:plastocyanin